MEHYFTYEHLRRGYLVAFMDDFDHGRQLDG
jgi:hypothetical protein